MNQGIHRDIITAYLKMLDNNGLQERRNKQHTQAREVCCGAIDYRIWSSLPVKPHIRTRRILPQSTGPGWGGECGCCYGRPLRAGAEADRHDIALLFAGGPIQRRAWWWRWRQRCVTMWK